MPEQKAAAALMRPCARNLSPSSCAVPPTPPNPLVIVFGKRTIADQNQKPAANSELAIESHCNVWVIRSIPAGA